MNTSFLFSVALATLTPSQTATDDPVLQWNEAALQAIKAEKTPPPVAARYLAILHVAMFDAVNSVRREYKPFEVDKTAPAGTSQEAAAAGAAHRVLTALYPKRSALFDKLLDKTAGDGESAERGLVLGRYVGKEILAWRAEDKSDEEVRYVVGREPGQWRPTPPEYAKPLVPQWPNLTCFALRRGFQFRSDGPPKMTDKAYTDAFNEVKRLGRKTGSDRSRDQTEIAHFWADGEGTITPPGHWNRIAQDVSRKKRLSLSENARLFGLLNVALADVGIACWDCKYHYSLWRPVHAIREADRDGNPDTAPDRDWEPLLITPPFPSYTSGHSSFSSAGATILAGYFGTDEYRFETTSDGLPDVTRKFNGFWAAAEEAGMSRIYGGIHYQFDNTDGLRCGKMVGEHVLKTCMRPVRR
jgi:hypothetical protein